MSILLYTYCKIFNIDPNMAQHTSMSLMTEMLMIHAESEKMKSDEMEKMRRRTSHG